MSINKSPKLSAKRTETDKKRSAFAKKGAATATGALNKPLGSNPKATIGFDAGQQAVLDKILAEEAADKVYVAPKWKIKLSKIMNHWSVVLSMTIITVYALFGDDVKIAFFERSADEAFNYITTICLVLFVVEITLNSLSQEGYFNSFYFWLDIISTVSLITDISWIW